MARVRVGIGVRIGVRIGRTRVKVRRVRVTRVRVTRWGGSRLGEFGLGGFGPGGSQGTSLKSHAQMKAGPTQTCHIVVSSAMRGS